jgi:hypothetical protein
MRHATPLSLRTWLLIWLRERLRLLWICRTA